MDKRTFYSQPSVSDAYDQLRFGGPSGARVNAREIELTLDLIPDDGRVLDLACGTGRVSRAIAARGQCVVGLDYSPPMAAKTASLGVPTVVGDGFRTPFGTGCFDAVVSLRFAFHYAELHPLLEEMRRLVAPGGIIVFDTYSWSPRSAIALGASRWGGRVHIHSRRSVRATAAELGLKAERSSPCFLFSPYLYRLTPLALERRLEMLERKVPISWLCRTFWQFRT
ncbi:MAG: class SAM-dependent methyltransferase [Chloroflexi bacterium]|nr:class SAM-dependent methyltransferase [Chloroflexota bacterium]